MKLKYREVAIYFSSILVLILFINFSINYITTKPLEIINFIQSDIHEDFEIEITNNCLLYTSPSPRDYGTSRMPSSA